MRILVTGGAGFLGSHLCSRLLNDGHSVISLDNLYTGSLSNLAELQANPNFQFIEWDVRNPIEMDVDGVFNLACPASPKHYQKSPVDTLTTSIQGAINVLNLAKSSNIRVLQASTSEVYGDPNVSPQHESYWGNVNPIGIRACYDEGKRAAETLFFDYQRQYLVDVRVARIFNTYGPKMAKNDGRVVSNFILQALLNQDITVFGNGKQTRSFCFIDDLIDGLVKLFNHNSVLGPINLGNPEPLSIYELAEQIIKLTNSNSKIVTLNLPEDDPTNRKPDIDLATNILGWKPQIGRELGLKKTIDYFRDYV